MQLLNLRRSVAIALGMAVIAQSAAAGKMYWTELGGGGAYARIKRANTDGTDVEVLVIPAGIPKGITVHAPTGKMYWTSGGDVWWANLDGSDAAPLVTDGIVSFDVRVSVEEERIYWLEYIQVGDVTHDYTRFWRGNLDGTDAEILFALDTGHIARALDIAYGQIYFTSNHGVQRVNPDGTGLEYIDAIDAVMDGIAVDSANGKVYWSIENQGEIYRANVDGTDQEQVWDQDESAAGIALDVHRQHIYFCSGLTNGTIRRIDFDGTQMVDLVFSTRIPYGIALDLACGNGIVDLGETCDVAIPLGSPGACPTACDDGDACTIDTLLNAGSCQAQCAFVPVTDLIDDDGCCPIGANANNDNDCVPVCGNGECEEGEDRDNCLVDCGDGIPAVSHWGAIILALGLLIAAKGRYRNCR